MWVGEDAPAFFSFGDNLSARSAIRSGIGPWCKGTMDATWITGRMMVVSLVVGAALLAPSEPAAQIAPDPDATSQPRDAVIGEIAFVGLRRISPAALTSKISSRRGIAFKERMVERDVRALARLGWFEDVRADIAGAVEPSNYLGASQQLRLTFYLPELPFLTGVEFAGSRLLSRQQIDHVLAEKKLTFKFGQPENVILLLRV